MATFELHHLSLAPRAQMRLFDLDVSKEEWLRTAFGARRAFEHRGTAFHWVPYGEAVSDSPILGVVERQSAIQHYEAPEEGGRPTSTDVWQGAVLTIDPLHHEDGQKLAFERGTKIGQPLAVLTSLVGALNDIPDAPYVISVKAIWDEESFAAFSKRHGNVVRSITFDFVVPNMFNLAGKLDESLKKVGDDTGAKHVKLTLESPDGVVTTGPEVQEGVAYGAKGQATVTAVALDGERYSSTDKVRTSRVSRLIGQGRAMLSIMRDVADEVLGRSDVDPNSTAGPGDGAGGDGSGSAGRPK